MNAENLFWLIVAIILVDFITDRVLDYLNMKNWSADLPEEAKGIYDEEKYKQSQEYFKVNQKFSSITSFFSLLLMLLMLFLGGFRYLDEFVRTYTHNPLWMALFYFAILSVASDIINLPFSLYRIFVIEERFGFNKTTLTTFFIDKLKGYFLGAVIGGLLFAVIIWIYQETGEYFWLLAWGVMTVFMVFATMFYASIVLPLFNKLSPLEEGELRTAIEAYCKKVDFKLDNLFVMNGSKRSTKANAFFSGLGAKKKIVLYDTLIEKHSVEELVAVLAHEVGHYKKKHTRAGMIFGVLQSGLMMYLLSLLIDSPLLSEALGIAEPSFHIGIMVFGILYSPLSEILGIGMNMLSRKYEFEADRYAAGTYKSLPLQTALKKLSVDSLSNLTPHPAYVFVYYSHPPLLKRLTALSRFE